MTDLVFLHKPLLASVVFLLIHISISPFFFPLAGMENKTNGSVEAKLVAENGQLPDPADWAFTDVVNYFKAAGFDEQATAFQDQEIDGKSLLLMTRNDVLTGLSIKLGPALKIYEYHVKPLQTQHLKSNANAPLHAPQRVTR
ncbi:sterile alpha motif domain-containing protein 13-like isoform X1 [Oncorhynchus clarkii lewisi]|uniref:sterile alpha motif domain-containing protein 13-like isoform X1 n=1 Tax=Oncorhynchus clarkii lewisi TaxID=490388 RepID=UPI0039B9C0AE